MIFDLPRVVEGERKYGSELEAMLGLRHDEPNWRLSVAEVQRLEYMYERSAGALVRLDEFYEPKVRA